jgi:hypothetical protein
MVQQVQLMELQQQEQVVEVVEVMLLAYRIRYAMEEQEEVERWKDPGNPGICNGTTNTGGGGGGGGSILEHGQVELAVQE